MPKKDWFRNTTWDSTIASQFDEKLSRSRQKAQYLHIQAYTLAKTYPHAALDLIDRYFALNDHFHRAPAHCARAIAMVSLGRITDAVESYEAALEHEAEFRGVKTNAFIDMPYLIAERELSSQYDRALEVVEKHKDRLVFPVQRFMAFATRALIYATIGNTSVAKANAKDALEAASANDSGFRYHSNIGLVSEGYTPVVQRVEAIFNKSRAN